MVFRSLEKQWALDVRASRKKKSTFYFGTGTRMK
jgi:hypothetical protein